LRALQEANQDLARLLEVESKLAAVQKELAETQTKLAETAAALEKSNDERDRLKQQVADLERRLQEAQDGWAASQSELAQQSALRQEIVGLKAKEGKMRRVVVVIDKSGSMLESNRWTDAQKVLRDWMRYLPMDECALVLFSNSMTVFPRGSNRFLRVSGTEGRANRDRICDLLADIVPNGGTDTLAALRKAYEYESPDAILLFTDGAPCKGSVLDMFSKYDPDMVDDIMDLVQKQKNRGIPINVVGMGNYFDKKFSKFLLDLARNTGGSFIGR
jgi:Mg-chelatase subunit ChlD